MNRQEDVRARIARANRLREHMNHVHKIQMSLYQKWGGLFFYTPWFNPVMARAAKLHLAIYSRAKQMLKPDWHTHPESFKVIDPEGPNPVRDEVLYRMMNGAGSVSANMDENGNWVFEENK